MTELAYLPMICVVCIDSVSYTMRYDVEAQKMALFFHNYFLRYLTAEEHRFVIEEIDPDSKIGELIWKS